MRKIKEVIRIKFEADLSHDRIAAATGVSKGTVTKYLQRAREVGLDWPLPEAMDDAQLQPSSNEIHAAANRAEGLSPSRLSELRVSASHRDC